MILKFKKLAKEAVIPTKANATDAGYDLTTTRFTQEFDRSGKMVLVYHTDIAVEIPEGHVGLLMMRSSVCERSVTLTNAAGVIDSGYRGELTGKFKITTDALPTIYQPGEVFAQLVIIPSPLFDVEVTDELSESDRGENGYGSSNPTEGDPEGAKGPIGPRGGDATLGEVVENVPA